MLITETQKDIVRMCLAKNKTKKQQTYMKKQEGVIIMISNTTVCKA